MEIAPPVWSPDGSQLAYVALRGSYERVYRKASNGEGTEELLYQYPGAGMTLSDWSMDGRFLSLLLRRTCRVGSVYVLPLGDEGERKPIEVLRSESQVGEPRLSPDGRFLSYVSDQSGKSEIYVRPFDPSAGAGAAPAAKAHGRCPTKVSRPRPSLLAAGRQGSVLRGCRSRSDGGRGQHRSNVRIRQAEVVVPPTDAGLGRPGARCQSAGRAASRDRRAPGADPSADHGVRPPRERC